jgi:hypothetical protein
MQPTPVGKQTYFNHCFKKKKNTWKNYSNLKTPIHGIKVAFNW